MHHTSYDARVICLKNASDLQEEFSIVGVDKAEAAGISQAANHYIVKLHHVEPIAAQLLNGAFTSLGGTAVVGRQRGVNTDLVEVILIGDRRHFAEAINSIEGLGLSGSTLASELASTLSAFDDGPILPEHLDCPHSKGRWLLEELKKRTLVMGILNVTPDSFSDGGQFYTQDAAVQRGVEMVEQGADIIDIGGESTRPGSKPVDADEEIIRVVPVIEELARRVEVPISIDTYHSETAAAALEAGASIINDISGMSLDSEMPTVAANYCCPVILMHTKGTPQDMQQNASYNDLMGEVMGYFHERIDAVVTAGVNERLIIVDPGIGFAKTAEHNLKILNRLSEFRSLGRPILVGVSRKATIGQLLGGVPPEDRVEGTAAAVAISIANGANIVRVHDVKEMARVVKVADAIVRG